MVRRNVVFEKFVIKQRENVRLYLRAAHGFVKICNMNGLLVQSIETYH